MNSKKSKSSFRNWIRNIFFRQKKPFSLYKTQDCQNCKHHFTGQYCPKCGQKVKEFDEPFRYILNDFSSTMLNLDSRFARTFLHLLFFPGKLTIAFFQGKRVTYAPPFRIFIFISFVLFFMLQIFTTNKVKSGMKEIDNTIIDSVHSKIESNIKSDKNDNDSSVQIIDSLLNKYFNIELKSTGNKEETLNNINVLTNRFREFMKSPDLFVSQIIKYLSWIMFLLLPLHAFVLKLFYIRNSKFYIRHLIFTVHYYSFLYLFILIWITLYWLFFENYSPAIFQLTIWIIPLIYLFLALKNFYKQRFFKTLIKFILLNIVTNFINLIFLMIFISFIIWRFASI